jgi:hypothetical protein
LEFPLPPATVEIICPHNPDHGMTVKRWLPPEEREMLIKVPGDVFEIDCPYCGKTEYRDEQPVRQ